MCGGIRLLSNGICTCVSLLDTAFFFFSISLIWNFYILEERKYYKKYYITLKIIYIYI